MTSADKKPSWSFLISDPRPGLALTGLAALLVGMACRLADVPASAATMAGLASFIAICWVTEVVPIPVTSLFPLLLFPLLGLDSLDQVAANYARPVIFLFLGGFLLAIGLQRSGAHRRVALWIIDHVGSRPDRLILGFMLATALLSMWISNTATVLVMLPIALAVLSEAARSTATRKIRDRLGVALMLSIAYSADIGGMATPVGTPPNLILLEIYSQLVPGRSPLGFGQWMVLGLPLAAVFLASGWLLLTRILFRFSNASLFGETELIHDARQALGRMRRDEWITALVFVAAALLWMTGDDLRLGGWTLRGWRSATGLVLVGDASVAIAAACLLFAIPSTDHPGETLLTWKQSSQVPWGLLLLFGGGFAVASGFQVSGLSNSIGHAMTGLAGLHPVVIVATVCVVITLLTEVTSNTATTSLILPILAEAAPGLNMDPLLLMIPATLSASCAFMMPVASPTQAIVYGSGYVTIRQMVRAGIAFNLLGVFWVTVLFLWLARPVFGIDW